MFSLLPYSFFFQKKTDGKRCSICILDARLELIGVLQISEQKQNLKKCIGTVDVFVSTRCEKYGLDARNVTEMLLCILNHYPVNKAAMFAYNMNIPSREEFSSQKDFEIHTTIVETMRKNEKVIVL